jgi:hypothetical protein
MSKNKSPAKVQRIPSVPRFISSGEAGDLLPAALISTLVFVLSTIYVLALMPVKTSSERQSGITGHQSGRNLYLAELQVTKFLPSPPTKWLSPVRCAPVGHGVWSAEGTALVTPRHGDEMGIGWKVFYAPDMSEFLYVEVGARHQGDLAATWRRIKGQQDN